MGARRQAPGLRGHSRRRRSASAALSALRSAIAIVASYSCPSGSEIVIPFRSRNTTAARRPVRLFPSRNGWFCPMWNA